MKKTILLALAMLAVLSVTFVVAEHFGYTDPAFLREKALQVQASAAGRWAVAGLVFVLLAGDLVLPVPSSVVMALSGMFLGFGVGTAVSFAGAMVGAWIGFYACRWGGRRAFRRLLGDTEKARVASWFRRRGVVAIILSRPVPMLTEVLSCLAGLSGLSPRAFTAAVVLGTLPVCAIYAWVGSASGGDFTNPWPAVWVSLLVPAAGWLVARGLGGGGDAGAEPAE